LGEDDVRGGGVAGRRGLEVDARGRAVASGCPLGPCGSDAGPWRGQRVQNEDGKNHACHPFLLVCGAQAGQ